MPRNGPWTEFVRLPADLAPVAPHRLGTINALPAALRAAGVPIQVQPAASVTSRLQ